MNGTTTVAVGHDSPAHHATTMPPAAIGSGKRSFFVSSKLAVLLIVMVFGAFGLYKLVGTFAAAPQGGYFFDGWQTFYDTSLTVSESTNGYGKDINQGLEAWAVFSRDSNHVAYETKKSSQFNFGSNKIIVANTDDTNRKEVFNVDDYLQQQGAAGHSISMHSITWSSDNKKIFVTAFDTDVNTSFKQYNIVINADGSGYRDLKPNIDESKYGPLFHGGYEFSPDNPSVLYTIMDDSSYYDANSENYTVVSLCKIDLANNDSATCTKIQGLPTRGSAYDKSVIGTNNMMFEFSDQDTHTSKIYMVDLQTAALKVVTDVPADEQTDSTRTTYHPCLIAYVAHTGSFVYSITTYKNSLADGSSSWQGTKMYSYNVNTGQTALMSDKLPDYFAKSYVAPKADGSQPALPASVPDVSIAAGNLVMPTVFAYGQKVVPTIDITNKSLTKKTYSVTTSKRFNGGVVDTATTPVTIDGNTTLPVQLSSFLVPAATSATYTYLYGNGDYYSVTVKNSVGQIVGFDIRYFGLPVYFTKTNPGSSVAKKKGNPITFSGMTIPGRKVKLYNKAKTIVLASGTSSSTGAYSFTFNADQDRSTKLCLAGFEDVSGGCYSVSITIK